MSEAYRRKGQENEWKATRPNQVPRGVGVGVTEPMIVVTTLSRIQRHDENLPIRTYNSLVVADQTSATDDRTRNTWRIWPSNISAQSVGMKKLWSAAVDQDLAWWLIIPPDGNIPFHSLVACPCGSYPLVTRSSPSVCSSKLR